ncbi:2-hydroxyacyl-CoA dehydratase [Petroclostridium sp. X23]|uniref:2-hydroxyacyl-CoA dehydratase family protein n=1 Tax=Petroclostridium sp. X23 TaxID=3045146 RepID=UPI0024AE73E3|nr:2-hydroxyacyl-CoA dehydratase [Petroclostridium sp. X23]WHH60236.1 2-hydroxyacyl-CoA dehydratase [Petroclostridium sp. X23]
MKKIGLTTTVPVEVLLAAGYMPVDINNIFITDKHYFQYIDMAERDGFPKSTCAWIKGIYGVCLSKGIDEIVGVVEGDCSNTRALLEVLSLKGIKVYPFSYPHSHTLSDVEKEIRKFMDMFGVQHREVEKIKKEAEELRQLAKKIDRLTYAHNKATGFENHLYQVSMSDFNGDRETFRKQMEQKINEIESRKSDDTKIRLGYIGVPPMTGDLYDFAETLNARIVYNEVQREFAFPRAGYAANIFEQYYDYTYPYDIEFRIQEIQKQIDARKIDAIVHYTQAFCYRAIEDIVVREKLGIPVLNIEGDKLNGLDARTKLRIEAFVDMVYDMKEHKG